MEIILKSFYKSALVKGTFILTAAGIISRIIGFIYRIFLTRAIGAQNLGLFQLVTPVIGIVFALCSSGIQTGISSFSAQKNDSHGWLFTGLLISLPLSISVSALIYTSADYIAARLLLNSSCTDLLKVLAFSFPFSTFHNCVNGYYYGHQKAEIPAVSQLLEQIVRVFTVFAYCRICISLSIPITVICACIGNLTGEFVSFAFCFICLMLQKSTKSPFPAIRLSKIKRMLSYSMPITSNRLLMHLLSSGETILLPAQLIASGLPQNDVLKAYGVLTGMALPLILFPTAITNSLSVMLIPRISKSNSDKNKNDIINTLDNCFTLCILMGIVSTFIFLTIGARLGAYVFNEPLVYNYTMILAWLCPFLYLSTTLAGILNGLSKTGFTCVTNTAAIAIRIFALVVFVPKYHIGAYLSGLLTSYIFICIVYYIKICLMFNLKLNPFSHIKRYAK